MELDGRPTTSAAAQRATAAPQVDAIPQPATAVKVLSETTAVVAQEAFAVSGPAGPEPTPEEAADVLQVGRAPQPDSAVGDFSVDADTQVGLAPQPVSVVGNFGFVTAQQLGLKPSPASVALDLGVATATQEGLGPQPSTAVSATGTSTPTVALEAVEAAAGSVPQPESVDAELETVTSAGAASEPAAVAQVVPHLTSGDTDVVDYLGLDFRGLADHYTATATDLLQHRASEARGAKALCALEASSYVVQQSHADSSDPQSERLTPGSPLAHVCPSAPVLRPRASCTCARSEPLRTAALVVAPTLAQSCSTKVFDPGGRQHSPEEPRGAGGELFPHSSFDQYPRLPPKWFMPWRLNHWCLWHCSMAVLSTPTVLALVAPYPGG